MRLRCNPTPIENLRDQWIADAIMSSSKRQVAHNEAAQRFELTIDGKLSRADYRLRDGVMHLVHTEVPMQQEGRGIAATLVRAALDHARQRGYKVRPACSYVRSFMARHHEFDELLA